MPTIYRPLEGTDRTVTREICRYVGKDLMRKTGFTNSYDVIFKNELTGKTANLNNLFNLNTNDQQRSRFQTYLFIEPTETYVEEDVLRRSFQTNAMPYVFSDTTHGIYMRTIYASSIIKFNFSIRCNSKVELDKWIEKIRLNHQTRRLVWHHTIPYLYKIPDEYLVFLGDAFTLISAVDDDITDLGTYINDGFRDEVQKRMNLTKTHTELYMGEQQHDVTGYTDDEFFYNTKNIQDNIYEISIPYTMEYWKPFMMKLVFPGTIGNTTLPDRYVDNWIPPVDRTVSDGNYRPYYYEGLQRANSNKGVFYLGDGGSRLREWDDWFPENFNALYQTITIAPILVDTDNPNLVVDLNDFPDDYLPTECVTFIKAVDSEMRLMPYALIGTEVYQVDDDETKLAHSIDDDGVITTDDVELDPAKRYYIRISLMRDLSRYSSKYTRVLLQDPDLALPIFQLYDDTVTTTTDRATWVEALNGHSTVLKQGGYPDIDSVLFTPGGEYITTLSYTFWLRKLTSVNTLFKMLTPHAYMRVLTGKFKAYRRSN